MKATLVTILLLHTIALLFCQESPPEQSTRIDLPVYIDIMTAKPMSNVFLIRYIETVSNDTLIGTAFNISYKNRNYWVSAKHLFLNTPHNQIISFDLYQNRQWIRINQAQILLHTDDSVDIAVFPSRDEKDHIEGLFLGSDLLPGDDGFLLGFPNGLGGESQSLNNGRPFPLLRKVAFAGVMDYGEVTVELFDGQSVGGFSGGPILFRNRQNPDSREWYVEGVIKGGLASGSGYVAGFGHRFIREIIEANR